MTGASPKLISSIISRIGAAITPRPWRTFAVHRPTCFPPTDGGALIRKEHIHFFQVACDRRHIVSPEGAHQQIVLHAHAVEKLTTFRNLNKAEGLIGRHPHEIAVVHRPCGEARATMHAARWSCPPTTLNMIRRGSASIVRDRFSLHQPNLRAKSGRLHAISQGCVSAVNRIELPDI
jgi:hypothetical protein